jgi:hypothetical protein
MIWIIISLILVYSWILSYSYCMQLTTLFVGRLLSGLTGNISGRGMQDAITPQSQNLRNTISPVILIAIFALTTYFYAWHHGLWVVIATFILGRNIAPKIRGVKPCSPALIADLRKDMKTRYKKYIDGNDTMRANAIKDLIDKFDAIADEAIYGEYFKKFGLPTFTEEPSTRDEK